MSHSCKNKSYDTCKWVMSRVCSLSLRPSLGIFSRTMYDTCKWWVDMTHVNESYVSRVTCENESCDTTCENHFHIWISLCETCGLMSHTWRVRMSWTRHVVLENETFNDVWAWVVLQNESFTLRVSMSRSWELILKNENSFSHYVWAWVVLESCPTTGHDSSGHDLVDASLQWKLSLDWSNAFDQTVSWMSIQLWVV